MSTLRFLAIGTVFAVFAVEHQCVCCQVQGPFQAYRTNSTSYQGLNEEVAILDTLAIDAAVTVFFSFRREEVLLQSSLIGKDAGFFHDISVHKSMMGDAGVRKDSRANVVLSGATIILDFQLDSDLDDVQVCRLR